MKILITGAMGFVGRRLLSFLEASDYEICVLLRQIHPDYETVVCDLQSDVIPEDALNGVDKVFHLAGLAHDLGDADKVEKLYHAVKLPQNLAEHKLVVSLISNFVSQTLNHIYFRS